jgi:hypothetical protein
MPGYYLEVESIASLNLVVLKEIDQAKTEHESTYG